MSFEAIAEYGLAAIKNEADILRASVMLLDEFREGKIGRISLEFPEEKI
jgi:ribosome biogenesis GTPase A